MSDFEEEVRKPPTLIDIPTQARARETVAERVEFIADVMENLQWTRGKTARELAAIWGISESRVQDLSAEASRLVTADASEARRDISAGCRKLFVDAVQNLDAKSAKAVGELWAAVSGAKAPEKHEVATVEATPEAAAAKLKEIFRSNVNREVQEDTGEAPPDS